MFVGPETSARERTGSGGAWSTRNIDLDDELASMRGTSDLSGSDFAIRKHTQDSEKRKTQPLESSHVRGLKARAISIGKGKRKMEVGRGGKERPAKARTEDRSVAAVKPASSFDILPGELECSLSVYSRVKGHHSFVRQYRVNHVFHCSNTFDLIIFKSIDKLVKIVAKCMFCCSCYILAGPLMQKWVRSVYTIYN